MWRVSDISSMPSRSISPEVAAHFAEITTYAHLPRAVVVAFSSLPSISIDYGVMEKADNVAIVTGNFGWDDLGTWSTFSIAT